MKTDNKYNQLRNHWETKRQSEQYWLSSQCTRPSNCASSLATGGEDTQIRTGGQRLCSNYKTKRSHHPWPRHVRRRKHDKFQTIPIKDLSTKFFVQQNENRVLWAPLSLIRLYLLTWIRFSLFIFFIFSLLCFRLWMNVGLLRTNDIPKNYLKKTNFEKHCYWIANANYRKTNLSCRPRSEQFESLDPKQNQNQNG